MNISRFREITLNLLRVVAAFLFMCHGAQKLFAVLGRQHAAALGTMMGTAGVLEFYGGALILIGLFTRPVAFILCGEMAYAYWMSHFPRGFWPIQSGGELAALYCFLFLFFCANGGGDFSIDGWRRKRARKAAEETARV